MNGVRRYREKGTSGSTATGESTEAGTSGFRVTGIVRRLRGLTGAMDIGTATLRDGATTKVTGTTKTMMTTMTGVDTMTIIATIVTDLHGRMRE